LVVDGLPVCQLGCRAANLALKGQQFGCRPLSGLPGCQLGLKRSTIWLSTPVWVAGLPTQLVYRQPNSFTGNKANNPAGLST